MKIVIAHSDIVYAQRLKSFFLALGITNIHCYSNGYELLTHIIENHPKIVLVEGKLPGLNVVDIKKVLILKGIKTELMLLRSDSLIDSKIYQN